MYKNRSRGFTLIELLVVIAIIGILSAVVLASLSTARSKGNDAAVQSNLSTIQTQAEIFYGNNSNSYGTSTQAAYVGSSSSGSGAGYASCTGGLFSDPNIAAALKAADTANGTGSIGCVETGPGTFYEVAAQLTTNTGQYQCVDSTGKAETVTATFPTASQLTGCP